MEAATLMSLLTEAEAAALCKVHPRTIRRLIVAGKLKAANYGNGARALWRIHLDDLLCVQPASPPPKRERRVKRATAGRSLADKLNRAA